MYLVVWIARFCLYSEVRDRDPGYAFSDPTYVPDAPYDVTDRDLVADRDPASVPFPDKDPKRAYLPSVRDKGPVVDP